jgi:hypothetical protein
MLLKCDLDPPQPFGLSNKGSNFVPALSATKKTLKYYNEFLNNYILGSGFSGFWSPSIKRT